MDTIHEIHTIGEGDFTEFLRRLQKVDPGGIHSSFVFVNGGAGTPGMLIATIRKPIVHNTSSERH